jgi:hypothetical protein
VFVSALSNLMEVQMPVQIVMDRHGDSRHLFDAADAQSLAEAEARFTKLLREGYLPVAPGERGKPGLLLRNFDQRVDETIFVPPLQGG